MASATVTSKGQVTIPQSIRRALKVAAGDRLDFTIEGEGRVLMRPAARGLGQVKGLLHRHGRKPVRIEEMNAAIERRGQRKA